MRSSRNSFPSRGLRARLYFLVLFAVIPAFGAIIYHAVQDRHFGASEASRELQRLAQVVAFDYQLLGEGERQFLASFTHVPQIRDGLAGAGGACNRFLA